MINQKDFETKPEINDYVKVDSDGPKVKRILMGFDKKYISDDNNILGITNMGPQDIFMASKYTNPDFYIEILLTNETKRSIIFDTKDQQNAFFNKLKAELI